LYDIKHFLTYLAYIESFVFFKSLPFKHISSTWNKSEATVICVFVKSRKPIEMNDRWRFFVSWV